MNHLPSKNGHLEKIIIEMITSDHSNFYEEHLSIIKLRITIIIIIISLRILSTEGKIIIISIIIVFSAIGIKDSEC